MVDQANGAQAVVISIDPKRVYMKNKEAADPKHVVVEIDEKNGGPGGERFCWYQCNVKGGRETRDTCAVSVAKATQHLGAGEIMLNCIDMDRQGNGYHLPLMPAVAGAVTIPVIASSGLETKVILWKYSDKHRFKMRWPLACFTEKKWKLNPVRALCAMLANRQGNSHRNYTYIC